MLFTSIKAFIYGTVFVAFWAVLALSVRVFDSYFDVSLPHWTQAAGIIPITAGGILALISVITLVSRGQGTQAPFDPPKEFVVAGPYKYVRNPMYIGGFALLLGFSLTYNSISMIFFWLLTIAISQFFLVMFEEEKLEKRFGNSYLEYKKSVNRWIPKVPRNI